MCTNQHPEHSISVSILTALSGAGEPSPDEGGVHLDLPYGQQDASEHRKPSSQWVIKPICTGPHSRDLLNQMYDFHIPSQTFGHPLMLGLSQVFLGSRSILSMLYSNSKDAMANTHCCLNTIDILLRLFCVTFSIETSPCRRAPRGTGCFCPCPPGRLRGRKSRSYRRPGCGCRTWDEPI